MYSLSKIDPMRIDPEQIHVAIRVHESVNAMRGSAQIAVGYKADDGSMDEEHDFDVQLTSARTMKDFQQRLYKYTAADGDGSFTLRLRELCLDKELPDGHIPLTLFLKTESHEDSLVGHIT